MKYTFWDNLQGSCLIRREDDNHFYVTDMIPWYNKEEGRKALLPHTKQWGTDSPEEHDLSLCKYLGELEVPVVTMSQEDKSVLQRCIDKEGFDYAMFHYSDYKTVSYNRVADKGFHNRLDALISAHDDLKMYLELQGISL